MTNRFSQDLPQDYAAADTGTTALQQALVQAYYQRQALPTRTVRDPGHPSLAPADGRTLFGAPTWTAPRAEHNRFLQQTDLLRQKVVYAEEVLAYTAYHGYVHALNAAGACEKALLGYDPHSLTFAFGGQHLLDTLEHLRSSFLDLADYTHAAILRGLR